jgi:hypothetical protein
MTTEDPANFRILTINGGSSSIKFALFETGAELKRTLSGEIQRIGSPAAVFRVASLHQASLTRSVAADDYAAAVDLLVDWIEERFALCPSDTKPISLFKTCASIAIGASAGTMTISGSPGRTTPPIVCTASC